MNVLPHGTPVAYAVRACLQAMLWAQVLPRHFRPGDDPTYPTRQRQGV